MDNKTVDEILKTSWWERKMLSWEHCAMKFADITNDYVLRNIQMKSVLCCFYNEEVYYFNIGTPEPEITETMIANGKWQVYTWSD